MFVVLKKTGVRHASISEQWILSHLVLQKSNWKWLRTKRDIKIFFFGRALWRWALFLVIRNAVLKVLKKFVKCTEIAPGKFGPSLQGQKKAPWLD